MRTDGRDAILNAAPRDGRLINRSPVIVSRDLHSLHYSAYHSNKKAMLSQGNRAMPL